MSLKTLPDVGRVIPRWVDLLPHDPIARIEQIPLCWNDVVSLPQRGNLVGQTCGSGHLLVVLLRRGLAVSTVAPLLGTLSDGRLRHDLMRQQLVVFPEVTTQLLLLEALNILIVVLLNGLFRRLEQQANTLGSVSVDSLGDYGSLPPVDVDAVDMPVLQTADLVHLLALTDPAHLFVEHLVLERPGTRFTGIELVLRALPDLFLVVSPSPDKLVTVADLVDEVRLILLFEEGYALATMGRVEVLENSRTDSPHQVIALSRLNLSHDLRNLSAFHLDSTTLEAILELRRAY